MHLDHHTHLRTLHSHLDARRERAARTRALRELRDAAGLGFRASLASALHDLARRLEPAPAAPTPQGPSDLPLR